MATNIEELKGLLAQAKGKVLESGLRNIEAWIDGDFMPGWAVEALVELFKAGEYGEINDRFFQTLAFGTGGMRGRTIGKVSAKAEIGTPSEQGTPAHAAVGSNCMNDFVVLRATMGLFNYCNGYAAKEGKKPRLVIAHDVRHFSKRFCDLSASLWRRLGGEVFIFDGPRSVPQLSFSVRYLGATAGIAITASHNPYYDNGYKVYFSDGAQITSPHAEGIVESVGKVSFRSIKDYLEPDMKGVETIGEDAENAYIKSIENSVIDKDVIAANKPKVVYSAVHGSGAVLCPKVMRHFGLEPVLVEEQMVMDPRFPTVKQPNPEYAETLSMGIELMKQSGADCMMATDPDSDRMGVAIRTRGGEIRLLTGNMIGSLLAEYRATQMKAKCIITKPEKCALIKTFVTTPLQDKIAKSHGLKCINTLTGFKWIGQRLGMYQKLLEDAVKVDYAKLGYLERAKLLQEHSTFFVFGGEESYGYLGTDYVRDKDANAAVIMFCEMQAYLKSQNKTVDEYLDDIYLKCGYYLEDLKSIYREGAEGSREIQSFLKMLDEAPMDEVGGVKVAKATNFDREEIFDADGVKIPREKFFFYTLENGYSFAIRASGTEPKVKFYAFAHEKAETGMDLAIAKKTARVQLDRMLEALENKFLDSIK